MFGYLMNKKQFLEKLQQTAQPVIVELWAPWCAPCRSMAPALERAAKEFQDRVELLRINADEVPELVRDLGVLGIPTLIAYRGEQELFRKSGAQSLESLQGLFASALAGESAKRGPSSLDRLLRAGAGVALAVIGLANPAAWLLLVPGGLLLFSAVYDRCPIYQAVAPRLKAWLKIRP
jgi:thioredoxin